MLVGGMSLVEPSRDKTSGEEILADRGPGPGAARGQVRTETSSRGTDMKSVIDSPPKGWNVWVLAGGWERCAESHALYGQYCTT